MRSIKSGHSIHVIPFFRIDVVAGSCPITDLLSRLYMLSTDVNPYESLSHMEERRLKLVVCMESNSESEKAPSIAQAAWLGTISIKRKVVYGENNKHVCVWKARYVRYTIETGPDESTGFLETDRIYAVTPHNHTNCGIPHARFSGVNKSAGFELDRASSQD
jgi:hypothetical protein